MKIGFASNDWSRSVVNSAGLPVMGGSGHIRLGQYLVPLRKRKVDVVLGILAFNGMTGTLGVHSWDGSGDHFDCDVIILQRYMHKGVLGDMKIAQRSGQIVINDVDDWYWGLSKENAAYAITDPLKNPDENIEWYKQIIMQSDGVLVSTPFLQKKIQEWNSNTRLQTNYVNTKRYADVKSFSPADAEKMVVGWMGSTAHRSGDLEILIPYVSKILKFSKLHHTGQMDYKGYIPFHRKIKTQQYNVSVSPFLPPHALEYGFLFDVGIVPLTNIPFNHAKSYIKGLEYAAAGVPFVCSWSPQYDDLVNKHKIGVLAEDPSDYPKLLKQFTDFDYRQEVSVDLRRKVKAFDIEKGARMLLRNIKSLHKASWDEKKQAT